MKRTHEKTETLLHVEDKAGTKIKNEQWANCVVALGGILSPNASVAHPSPR